MTREIPRRCVLDASVAVKWFARHHEPDRDKAASLLERHESQRTALVIPEFALLEIVNAIRFSQRAQEADAIRALTLLERLRMQIVPLDWDLLRKAAALAWTYSIALYDAAYVALAERESCPLVTADEVMVKRLAGQPGVVRLAELRF